MANCAEDPDQTWWADWPGHIPELVVLEFERATTSIGLNRILEAYLLAMADWRGSRHRRMSCAAQTARGYIRHHHPSMASKGKTLVLVAAAEHWKVKA